MVPRNFSVLNVPVLNCMGRLIVFVLPTVEFIVGPQLVQSQLPESFNAEGRRGHR